MDKTISMTEAAFWADVERCTILRWIRKYPDLAHREGHYWRVNLTKLHKIMEARQTLSKVADMK